MRLTKLFLFSLCAFSFHLQAIDYQKLTQALGLASSSALIHNELHLQAIKGSSEDAEVTICCHGYSGNYKLGYILAKSGAIPTHVVSFNFPDFGAEVVHKEPSSLAFGSIEELLPLIYVMKECVVGAELDKIHLYGFSAGGGAIVNALAILSHELYSDKLQMIGVDQSIKKQILQAVQKGSIVLDCPLKSVEEMVAHQQENPQIRTVQEQFEKNNLHPINSLRALHDLSLNILLHFQTPDQILTNRDDQLYIDRLKTVNYKGKTKVVLGKEGAHLPLQPSLQAAYKEFVR